MGGPWDSSVSPSPFGLDFGTLDFETSDMTKFQHDLFPFSIMAMMMVDALQRPSVSCVVLKSIPKQLFGECVKMTWLIGIIHLSLMKSQICLISRCLLACNYQYFLL